MSVETRELEGLARRLRDAYTSGPVAPMRDVLNPGDGAGAYAVQLINTEYWQKSGRRIIGRKIGLTAAAVQKQLGVDQPDYGVLFDDMQISSGGVLPPDTVIQPKAEAEIAVVMRKDLCASTVSPEMIADAIDHVCAAIEIVDSRIENWKITFADTVADNGSSAFFVLSDTRHKLAGTDLLNCRMEMEVNGQVVSTGTGAACLGHPFNAAAWLAATLGSQGTALRAGDVILTGALGPMATLTQGDRVRAVISGIGEVGFHYGAAAL